MRAWLAAQFAVFVVFALGATSAAAVPANFWGVDPQITPSPEQFQRLDKGGVDSIRIPVEWGAVQPVAGVAPSWGAIDAAVGGAVTAGLDVLPFVYGAPSWAVPLAVVDKRNRLKAPRNLPVAGASRAGWSAFLQQAVQRYGPDGTFWIENPAIPKHPIRTWQIWNEANFKYFIARPNPAEYGKLVKISYAAIKAVDAGAKIVLGGLFSKPSEALPKRKNPPAYFASDFLNQMYRATPGIKSKFNGVALHPYTGSYQELTPDIEEVRAVLKANHDPGKGLWITEMGWSSKPGGNGFAKGISGQKVQLQGAFRLLKREQAKWKIKRVYWFSVDDQVGTCNFCDGSGLFSAGFVPKPSWFAFVKFAGGVAG